MAPVGRRQSRGADILEKLSCRSGGGPPLGWPLIMTESPERTYKIKHLILYPIFYAC